MAVHNSSWYCFCGSGLPPSPQAPAGMCLNAKSIGTCGPVCGQLDASRVRKSRSFWCLFIGEKINNAGAPTFFCPHRKNRKEARIRGRLSFFYLFFSKKGELSVSQRSLTSFNNLLRPEFHNCGVVEIFLRIALHLV